MIIKKSLQFLQNSIQKTQQQQQQVLGGLNSCKITQQCISNPLLISQFSTTNEQVQQEQSQFKSVNSQSKLPNSQRIVYPSIDQYFPGETLNKSMTDIPALDNKLMSRVFDTDMLKEPQQRAAYFTVNKNGKTYHVFDASKIPLGRMCQKISILIRGKDKPTYKNNEGTCGDNCIVINAGNIFLTGRKAQKKKIFYHTGFVGHLKTIKYSDYLINKPEQLIVYIISKQMPKNLLRRDLLKKVDVFRGAEHNMIDKFPNFMPTPPEYDYLKPYAPENLALNQNMTITYTSSDNIPEEFSHLKFEENSEIQVPFENRQKVLKMTEHNKQVVKEWRQYFYKQKRYTVYKAKLPKSKIPNIETQDMHVKSQKQINRWGIQHLVEDDDSQEIDDETSKSKFE